MNHDHATATGPEPERSARLYFLDWVRILAFCLLVLYHVGMYYVSWGWHVKSVHASTALEPLMLLASPWRLGLLFLVSGVASAFMLERLRPGAFIRQRSRRLLLPLLFGVLVVVPAQAYYEVIEKFGYRGSFTDFTGLYLSGYGGFCSAGSCLVLPTWNHLWFVPYLWVYTLLLALLTLALGPRLERLSHGLAQALAGWRILLLPLAVLALARIALLGRFAPTHALVDDWSNHAQYLPLFLLGALLARRREFWARLELLRRPSLAIALGCWALLLLYRAVPDGLMAPEQLGFWRDLQRAVYALCGWSAIMAVCGFAHRHLQFDHPLRRYLTQAVFPVYIVHQTLIVLFSQWLKPAELAPGSEGLLLVGLTFCVSFGLFEVVRRVPLLRPFFGLAKQQRRGRAAAQPRHASGNRG